eukprot:80018_1
MSIHDDANTDDPHRRIRKYKSNAELLTDQTLLRQELLDEKMNMFLTFKNAEFNKSTAYPRFAQYQYYYINAQVMLILLFGIIVISTINTGFAQHTTLLIFTISLQFMMLLLISITSISPLTKHSIHNNSCCIHLKYSSYTICIGIVLFYVLIHYSIAGTFTTDSFLLYFCITLFITSSFGYIPFIQYLILSTCIFIEYNTSTIFRHVGYVNHGHIINEAQIIECLSTLDFHVQLEGRVALSELVFGNILILVVSCLIGYNVYAKEKQLKYLYLESLFVLNKTHSTPRTVRVISDALDPEDGEPTLEAADQISELSPLNRVIVSDPFSPSKVRIPTPYYLTLSPAV